ncbi:MAG: HAAS signaling domain-containing protein [Oscillospiraceae bacterium]
MKHNDAVIRQYCRAVGKRLPLPAAQRRQLLAGLREELTESAQDCTTLDELIARVGTPDEAAQELLSGIAPERVYAYQKKRRWRYILAAALIVLAVCCAALIYAQVLTDSSVAYAEEHITILPATDLSEAGQ